MKHNAIELKTARIKHLPAFSNVNTATIKTEIEQAINTCKAVIDDVVKANRISYRDVVDKVESSDDALSQLWSPISHMNSVISSDELRAAHDACLPVLSEYSTWVGQHAGLYNCYQQLADSAEYAGLSKAQQQVVTNAIRDFTLSGVALNDEKKARYAQIQASLSALASSFGNNVLDATMAFSKHVTNEAILSGLPESAMAAAQQAARKKDLQGWLFTLDLPSYLPVLMYADNAELRKELYTAYATRASELGPNAGEFDNSDNIAQTLKLKQEAALLLGFSNYSERSLATKMATSETQVIQFLNDLADKSKPQAKQDVEELTQFAKECFQATELNAWDLAYYSEKLKQQKYAISDELLRPYFPEYKVVEGLFNIVSKLYGVNIMERTGVNLYHDDVKYYEIEDANGNLRGGFYLDLYAREKKRGGAWMDECAVRRMLPSNELQYPVAFLTCNFNGPVDGKPALFTHDEVVTLFHEFGHGLHHMLTKITVGGVSGINGVAWDAVELPSQFLENWCWQPESLTLISGHYETGESLPTAILEKMLAAKNFQSAMQMLRQLEFSLFDFILHQQTQEKVNVQSVIDEVRSQVSVLNSPEFNRFQNSFSHIFAGGYAAGYYSYKWAEVLSSDAFGRFEEEGLFNQQTGQDFLHNVLEVGGSVDAMEMFKAFRGREPQVDALLRHSGISANTL